MKRRISLFSRVVPKIAPRITSTAGDNVSNPPLTKPVEVFIFGG
jgi:hypothetical protein